MTAENRFNEPLAAGGEEGGGKELGSGGDAGGEAGDGEDGDVVLLAEGEGGVDGLAGVGAVGDEVGETVEAEEIAFGGAGFEEAVCIEGEAVADGEGEGGSLEGCCGKDAEGQGGGEGELLCVKEGGEMAGGGEDTLA